METDQQNMPPPPSELRREAIHGPQGKRASALSGWLMVFAALSYIGAALLVIIGIDAANETVTVAGTFGLTTNRFNGAIFGIFVGQAIGAIMFGTLMLGVARALDGIEELKRR